jgi:hypothetical protein
MSKIKALFYCWFVLLIILLIIVGCAPVEGQKKIYSEDELELKPSIKKVMIEGHSYMIIGVGVEHNPDCSLDPDTKCFKRK